MHLLCDATKIFEALSPIPLEQDINRFQEHHKVKSVDVRIQQKSQKGYMLCDRVGDKTDIYNVYLATVRYERDLTQERVDEAVDKWLIEKVNKKFKSFSTGPANIFNVADLNQKSVEDCMREYAEECMASDELKALRSRLEVTYSAPDEGEKL